MTTAQNERRDIESLLPWHAAGTLSRRDAQRVELGLAGDPDLARQFALVREELAETIHLNETLGAPSVHAMARVLAGIEAEGAARRRPGFLSAIATSIGERLSQFRPRTLALSATIGALAIVLQAGFLAEIYLNERGDPTLWKVQSVPTSQKTRSLAGTGSYVLVGFAPQASAEDITNFLKSHKVSLVEGPRSGDLYKVRVSVTGLSKEDLARIVREMQDNSKVVRFIAPTE